MRSLSRQRVRRVEKDALAVFVAGCARIHAGRDVIRMQHCYVRAWVQLSAVDFEFSLVRTVSSGVGVGFRTSRRDSGNVQHTRSMHDTFLGLGVAKFGLCAGSGPAVRETDF